MIRHDRHGAACNRACNEIMPIDISTAKRNKEDPPAMRPELNSTPELRSDSPVLPERRSTHHRTMPPMKMGAVVAMGR